MPRALIFRKVIAAITMATAALCGGVKAHAEQDGTLSIVEMQTAAPLRPDQNKKAAGYLRSWLSAQGVDAAVAPTKSGKLSVWSQADHQDAIHQDLPSAADFGIHLVKRTLEPGEDANGLASGLKAVPEAGSDLVFVVDEQPMIAGDGIESAEVSFASHNHRPSVAFRFNDAATLVFADVTRKFVEERFAIVINDEVVFAPMIREPITGGFGQLTGSFTVEEAQALAAQMTLPPFGITFVVRETCTSAEPRAPPIWGPKWIAAEPACD